jgi:aryl-alcohol dehydrogenase-like predicted oxidoreductase
MTQGDIDPVEGGRRLAKALELGVNFWDTSDDYGTHPHVREGLKRVKRVDVVIADKTNASTEEDGRKAIELAFKDLDTDYIDIMFLHVVPPQRTERRDTQGNNYTSYPLRERMGALNAFLEAKDNGLIKATALSTHSTKVLRETLDVPELDVICTPLNIAGNYLDDGTESDRIRVLKELKDSGKFIYLIKILDAGKLIDSAEEAIKYAIQFHEFIDAWNIGMYGPEDVRKNLRIFQEYIR